MEHQFPDSDKPIISIIISTKGNVKLLKTCIESIETVSSYQDYEILVIDNSDEKEEAKIYLSSLKHKVLSYNKSFNFSRINNFAVASAKGEHVIFLNDDTLVISSNWMEHMLEYSTKPSVGAVGVLLFYPNDTIQHAGVLIGVGGITSHAFEGLPRTDKGYKFVAIEIFNPDGILIHVDQISIGGGGSYYTSFITGGVKWTETGAYTVIVH